MSGELIERLRLVEAWKKPGGPTPKQKMPKTYEAVKDAADAITTLTEQVARLKGALVEAKRGLDCALLWSDDDGTWIAHHAVVNSRAAVADTLAKLEADNA